MNTASIDQTVRSQSAHTAPSQDCATGLLARYQRDIAATLSCYDRLLFQGTLPKLRFAGGMESFLRKQGVLLKDYSRWAEPLRDQIRAQALKLASEHNLEIQCLRKRNVRKEELVQRILEQRGQQPGLVAIFSCMEKCQSYIFRYQRRSHRWVLAPKPSPCLHYYFYFIDPLLGLCFFRLPTWAPFRVQIYTNGHQWLARRLEREGVPYQLADNAFTAIGDFQRAQQWADQWRVEDFQQRFDQLADRFCPVLKELGMNFQWTINQAEYATDIIFRKPSVLQPLYERLVRTASHAVKPAMIATFLGKRAQGNYPAEVGNHLQKRISGTRLKHVLGKLSIKLYDKMGLILRIETTANDVNRFSHYRLVEQRDGPLVRKWAVMRKSIYSLPILQERMQSSNKRYLEYLSSIEDPRAGVERLERFARPVRSHNRNYAGFNFFSPQDLALLEALMQGEHHIVGLRNRDLRDKLPRLNAGQISRLLKRLHVHGLIKKSGPSYRYFLTSFGEQAVALGLKLRALVVIPELAA